MMECAKNITVIVPTLARYAALERLFDQLKHYGLDFIAVQASGETAVLADGAFAGDGLWLKAPASRGGQIAAGIAHCNTDWIWVLHDDSELYAQTVEHVLRVVELGVPRWGRCNVRFKESGWPLRMIAGFMNLRSKLSKICTGDQGMFFHRRHLELIGGVPAQPLMEDVELSKQLKRMAGDDFLALPAPLGASGRRWIENGYAVTILQMWRMRWRYFFGANADALFKQYYRRQR